LLLIVIKKVVNAVVLQTFRHGFPYQPTVLAYDPVQNILAIGTKTGALRMYPSMPLCPSLCVCVDMHTL